MTTITYPGEMLPKPDPGVEASVAIVGELEWDSLVFIVADHFQVDKASIHQDTSFADDLKADSLERLDFFFTLETKFQLALSSDDETPETVGQLATLLTRKASQIRGH